MSLTRHVVRIERPQGASIAKMFDDIRIWLDHEKVQPARFSVVTNMRKHAAMDVEFSDEDDARRFATEFSRVSEERRYFLQ
jgi:hypothetical protein